MTTDLDIRGLRCPVTTGRLKRHAAKLAAGTKFRVFADDSDSKTDIPAFVSRAGYDLVSVTDNTEHQVYEIVKTR